MNAPPKLPGGAGAPPGDTRIPLPGAGWRRAVRLARGSQTRPPKRGQHRRSRKAKPKRNVRKRGSAPYGRRDGAPRGATCRKRYVTTTQWRAAWRAIPSFF